MHAVRGCGAGGGFGGYAAEGGSGEEVRGANQVMGVVLENVRLKKGGGKGKLPCLRGLQGRGLWCRSRRARYFAL